MSGGRFEGGCHCGAVRVEFETSVPPAQLPLRACGCSFCRRHGTVNASDPRGRLTVRGKDLRRYTFGTRSCDFLLCTNCGVYVAAVLTDGGRTLGTLNIQNLYAHDAFSQPVTPMNYGHETPEARRQRRLAAWTPTTLEVG